jgi:hypothetical protein
MITKSPTRVLDLDMGYLLKVPTVVSNISDRAKIIIHSCCIRSDGMG